MPFYAVKIGKNPGIYNTWTECQKNTSGFSGAKFHKFNTKEEAEDYLKEDDYKLNNYDSDKLEIHYPCFFIDGSFNERKELVGSGLIFKLNENEKEKIFKIRYDAKVGSQARISRNIYGEINAALKAVAIAIEKRLKEINIYYDYIGIEMWVAEKNPWNVAKEKKFITDYIELVNIARNNHKIKINFYKVPAHSGIELNERVDILAKEAAGF